jgi:hypothetical protein
MLIGVAVFLLPVLITLPIVVVKRIGSRPAVSREGEDPEEGKAARSAPPDDPGTAPVEKSTPDPLLEVVGGLTGAHLYQSHLSIGLLADAVEEEVYEVEQAGKMLATLTSTIEAVDKQLARIPVARMDAEEQEHLDKVRKLGVLMKAQTSELRLYWETGKKEHADRFQKARSEAWTGIQELLEEGD